MPGTVNSFETLSTVTTATPVAAEVPTLAAGSLWAYEGSTAPGAGANLVAGGPTIGVLGAPVVGVGSVTLNPGGALGAYDSTITRASTLTTGWAALIVIQSPTESSTNLGALSDGGASSFAVAFNPNNAGLGHVPSIGLTVNGVAPTPINDQEWGVGDLGSAPRMFGISWLGQGMPMKVYCFTDGTTFTTADVTFTTTTATMKFGNYNVSAFTNPLIGYAWVFEPVGLDDADMATLAAAMAEYMGILGVNNLLPPS